MKIIRSIWAGTPWLCLAVTALLVQGCARQPGWNGIFAADVAGAARVCAAPAAAVPDGQAIVAQIQVSNEGGWCGITISRSGSAYDSYLLVTRPVHGRVFAHRVGGKTRIDYAPDRGFAGADKFSVRLVPGNGVIEVAASVTK
jgi:hypothetical protein